MNIMLSKIYTCDQCAFWRPERGSPQSPGECRRYPKIVRTDPDSWCGEYKSRSQLITPKEEK